MSNPKQQIWDGNGGKIDPNTVNERDLLIILHVKMDNFVVPKLSDLEERTRVLESLKSRLLGAVALGVFLTGLVVALVESNIHITH